MKVRRVPLGILLVLLALPASVRAEKDWFASLYTSEGIELRADERVFALYAVLNALGYDEAPVSRRFPVPAREMDPIRLEVRAALALEPAQRQKFEAFFTAHPQPAEAYARHALTLEGPAGFAATPATPPELQGLGALLAETYAGRNLGELFERVQAEYRSALKGYHAVIDAPVLEARRVLRMKEDEPPRVVLVVNLLDGRGQAFSTLVGEELYVLLGPSAQPDLYSLVHEVARNKLAPIANAKAGTSKSIGEAALAAGAAGAGEFAAEVYARAFTAVVLKLPAEKLAEKASGGYHAVLGLVPLVEKFLATEASLEDFVAENLWLVATKEAPAPAPQ